MMPTPSNTTSDNNYNQINQLKELITGQISGLKELIFSEMTSIKDLLTEKIRTIEERNIKLECTIAELQEFKNTQKGRASASSMWISIGIAVLSSAGTIIALLKLFVK